MKGLRQIDGSVIWADGSRTYPPSMHKAKEPKGTYTYPPAMGGIPVEVPDESPAQGAPVLQYNPGPTPPVLQYNPGPMPPTIPVVLLDVEPLPSPPSPADVWDRWGKLVANWACLIAWAGDLDKLSALIGDMPLYAGSGSRAGASKTAIGWWRDVISAGYDKAAAPPDLAKGLGIDANDVAAYIQQINALGPLARAKGYTGCPAPPAQNPAEPPAPPTPLATAQGWWQNLSPTGKVVTGVAGLTVVGLIIRGAAK